MGKTRSVYVCSGCGQQLAQWAGRCPGCGAWGSVGERSVRPSPAAGARVAALADAGGDDRLAARVRIGLEGVDRVLGGGLVPATVALLAGEPGIGKSTLLLQILAALQLQARRCLLASGEESREQVAMRARRLGIDARSMSFVAGRDLADVLAAASDERPFLLAVDSIQTLRDGAAGLAIGGPSQVRGCADALVGFAKANGVAVLMTGHVTKDGELAGPRTLEHAVDVVLTFDGDPRSGLRMLSGGKNRFGPEGELAWFEMRSDGLAAVEPADLLLSAETHPGAAIALPRTGRRALAVEVQALVSPPGEGVARRQATGLDGRRFHLVAAVLDRAASLGLSRSELFGASAGGVRINDPASDLAVAAALASAASGVPAPERTAFVGEVTLTGLVRPPTGMPQRLSAARAAGLRTVVAAPGAEASRDVRIVPAATVAEAVEWALHQRIRARGARSA